MPTYSYIAKTSDGTTKTGIVEAARKSDAIRKIESFSVFPIKVNKIDPESVACSQGNEKSSKDDTDKEYCDEVCWFCGVHKAVKEMSYGVTLHDPVECKEKSVDVPRCEYCSFQHGKDGVSGILGFLSSLIFAAFAYYFWGWWVSGLVVIIFTGLGVFSDYNIVAKSFSRGALGTLFLALVVYTGAEFISRSLAVFIGLVIVGIGIGLTIWRACTHGVQLHNRLTEGINKLEIKPESESSDNAPGVLEAIASGWVIGSLPKEIKEEKERQIQMQKEAEAERKAMYKAQLELERREKVNS